MIIAHTISVPSALAQATTADPGEYGSLVAGWHPADVTLSGTDVTSWPARWGTGTLAVLGAPQYEAAGWGGSAPSILFDGVDDAVYSDSIGSFASGDDMPWYWLAAVHILDTSSARTLVGFGRAASANPRHHLNTTTTDRWQSNRRQDSGANVNVTSASSQNVTGRQILGIEFTGTAWTLRRNGAALSGMNSAAQDAATTTLDQFSMAVRRSNSTQNQWYNVRLGAVLLYSSLTNEAGARAFLTGTLGYAP